MTGCAHPDQPANLLPERQVSNTLLNQYQLKLERAEAIIGYHPQKPEKYYLWEALQVAGSGHTRISGRSAYNGNKRLAIVDDSAMALALARPWYEKDEILGLS